MFVVDSVQVVFLFIPEITLVTFELCCYFLLIVPCKKNLLN